jgi:hypothetical protein
MSTKTQIVKIDIPEGFDKSDIESIGEKIVETMRRKAEKGKGAPYGEKGIISDYVDFPEYSKEYIKSLNFKIAGKSKSDVNLTLSGDMLAAFGVIKVKDNSVTLGFDDDLENAKADGNIRGTYGSDRANRKKARNFLGITKDDLERILAEYERTPKPK